MFPLCAGRPQSINTGRPSPLDAPAPLEMLQEIAGCERFVGKIIGQDGLDTGSEASSAGRTGTLLTGGISCCGV